MTKKKVKTPMFPCIIHIENYPVGTQGALFLRKEPTEGLRMGETLTLAVYRLDSFVTVSNKTTVEPVKPAKKSPKKGRSDGD